MLINTSGFTSGKTRRNLTRGFHFRAPETAFEHQIEADFLGACTNTAAHNLIQIIEDGMERQSSTLPLFHTSNLMLKVAPEDKRQH